MPNNIRSSKINNVKNKNLNLAFSIMWKNEVSSDVYLSNDKKYVHVRKYTSTPGKQPFMGGDINTSRIYDFLKSRCYEDNYAGLKEVLKTANLNDNNPWKWCKHSHGVTWDDFLWIKYPEETNLTWNDVKCRG